MLAALALMQGFLLGQTPMLEPSPAAPSTAAPSRIMSIGVPQAKNNEVTPSVTTAITASPATDDAKPQDASSIFSRPFFADRHSLSFLFGTGPGRFNMIDWESRPNADRLWWLGRWSANE